MNLSRIETSDLTTKYPDYYQTFEPQKQNEIQQFINQHLNSCHLCGHHCGAPRIKTTDIRNFNSRRKSPYCGAYWEKKQQSDEWVLEISSINLHFGEEPPISGKNGSGTIFFTHCSLKCVYCQNYPISSLGNGRTYTLEELVKNMLRLESEGAHNINLVSPTHYTPLIAKAIKYARKKGLSIPIVYNTGGYDSIENLKALEGLIEIYMPDIKYYSRDIASKYSDAPNYPEVNRSAIKEMFRQVGNLKLSSDGIAQKGLLIRHLVLPGCTDDSKKILEFIAAEISPNSYVSIMSQYHPAYKSQQYPELRRKLSLEEYQKVVDYAQECLGLENAFIQYME